LNGKGFGIEDAEPSIKLAHDIRFKSPIGYKSKEYHEAIPSIA